MTAQISKSEQDERGLLPYPVIIAATKGDPEAMNIVVQHYESYIASLSMRKLRDERGNIYGKGSLVQRRQPAAEHVRPIFLTFCKMKQFPENIWVQQEPIQTDCKSTDHPCHISRSQI